VNRLQWGGGGGRGVINKVSLFKVSSNLPVQNSACVHRNFGRVNQALLFSFLKTRGPGSLFMAGGGTEEKRVG
jgi:hypothetical protein